MDAFEKRRFIRAFVRNVQQQILGKVDSMPESWDSFELRQYIADSFSNEIIVMGKRRKKEYDNDVTVISQL